MTPVTIAIAIHRMNAQRNSNFHHEPAFVAIAVAQRLHLSVMLFEPRRGIGKADTLARAGLGRYSGAIVEDRDEQLSPRTRGAHFDQAGPVQPGDAVSNGVFYDGLEEKTGDIAVQCVGIGVYHDLQPVLKARALDGQIKV